MRAFFVWLLILPIRAYKLILSPWLGHSCRFQPTCSAYAIEALETHGPIRGLWLTFTDWRGATPGVGRAMILCLRPENAREYPNEDPRDHPKDLKHHGGPDRQNTGPQHPVGVTWPSTL